MGRTSNEAEATRRRQWVLLAYRLPREPSTPRITVWRKMKRLGVAKLLDGLVALPLDARNREQLEWVAQDILDAGGEATVWIGRPALASDERNLEEQMRDAVALEYRALVETARSAGNEQAQVRSRTVARLRRELHRISQRDHSQPPERDQAALAVEELATSVAVGA
jgi:hypothetical protein